MAGRSEKSSRRKAKTAASKSGSRSRSSSSKRDEVGVADATSDAVARRALLESDKLYYRIGEVSRITGVKAHVLRYWETEFRWMAPPKSRSKQRLYRKRDIEFVWLLKRLLWEERYTIAGARQRIQELGADEALALLDQPPGHRSADASSPVAAGGSDAAPDAVERGQRVPQAEWVKFRAALREMQTDLLSLRAVLQD